jgi:DtxR family transcriptional regulator, Mn-dependent transcriptional regulator
LAAFLGHPEHDPHGDPIPAKDGTMEPDDSFPLAEAAAGQRIRVFSVGPEDAPTLAVLEGSGLLPGKVLTVREVRALDGLVTVEGEDGETRVLGGPLAHAVFVRSASKDG